MTTTMNLTTTQDYWTQTARFVAIHDAESAGIAPRCEEVSALTSSKWDEHKFGLCCECACGIDDESEFVITGNANGDDTVLMCYTCYGGSAQRRRNFVR